MAQNGSAATPEVAQIAAAVTAVVGVFTGLAVTGALSNAQRNHGDYLLIAFSCVLAGAVLWFTAVLIPAKTGGTVLGVGLATVRWLLQVLGVLAFAAGIVVGLIGLITTQGESERPSVSASFDAANSVLAGTASADGLNSNQAVHVRVQGMSERVRRGKITLLADRRDLYYALVGPDSAGKVSDAFSVFVPRRYRLVGVKVWSGEADLGCQIYENVPSGKKVRYPASRATASKFRPSDEDGCLVLRLPARAATKAKGRANAGS